MEDSLQALIFDVDGTLAETEEAHREAFNQAFADRGVPWSWDRALYRDLLKVSGGKERMRAYAEALVPASGDGPPEAPDVVALHARKTTLYTAAVRAGGVPLRPGVQRLMNEARVAGLRLAVATTTTRANVLALLDGATGGRGHDWFECLCCADDAPIKKPDPQVYHVALDRLGLKPWQCLALEDSANGVRAARAAGVPVVVSQSVYTQGDDFTGALAVFPDFEAVTLEDLKRLHARAVYP